MQPSSNTNAAVTAVRYAFSGAGLSHGLIVLPVLLSLVGPKGQHTFTPTVRVIVTKEESGDGATQTLIEL